MGGTGILGLLAWLAWVGVTLGLAWASVRRGRTGGFARGVLCAWVVFHINGLTQVNFWESKVLHQMMWVVAWTLLWASQPSKESEPA